jgi:hypothetical protein
MLLRQFNLVKEKEIKKNMSGINKKAIITGIIGQDGAFLAQLLLDKGY